jgi:succinoglycan biosynthesis transport protein ExoP
MNLSLLISALRARFGVFALVLGITVLVALVASLLMPRTYKATASLLVDANKDPQQTMSATDFYAQPRERVSYMQTQVGIITSSKVAQAVARDLKLADDPAAREAFRKIDGYRGTIEEWLGAQLSESLKVETSQSNIINITVVSRDPTLAARAANAFARRYMDTTLELRVEPTRQAAAWFDEQLKGLRANLEEAQAKLSHYQKQHGIVSTDEKSDIENMRLNDLAAQVMRAQEQSRGRGGRAGSPDQLPSVQSNPMVQKLSADLAAGESKLVELSAQYGPNYPAYQRQVEENRALRQRLNAETSKAAGAVEGQRRQASLREAELKKALAEQHARVLELKQGRNELSVLTRNLEIAQKTYETAAQRAAVSQVESRASQTNITTLDGASTPARPFRPRLTLNVALAVLVGTMLGLGLAVVLELIDRRVRSASDLANDWNVPLLGSLNAQRPGAYALLGPARPAPALPRPA